MATRRIQGDSIDKAVKALSRLPELPRRERTFSTKETVKMLTEQILALKNRGYSMEHISAELKKLDIEISVASLRRYLETPKAPEADQAPEGAAPTETPFPESSGETHG